MSGPSLARGPVCCAHPAMALTGESPVWDAARGVVWWIDIQGQRLLGHVPGGADLAVPLPLMPGLVALDRRGDLVLGLEDGLWRYRPETGALDRIAETNPDPALRLNDGKFDAGGRLWFGTMDKRGPDGGPVGALWRRDPDGALHLIRPGVSVPNAICFSPAGDRIYFADSPLGRVETAPMAADGRLGDWQVLHRFAGGEHPDGAFVAGDGALWVAVVGGGRIDRILPDGRAAGHVALPVSRPTMACPGGANGTDLFVTSQRRFLSAEALRAEPWAGALIRLPLARPV